MVAKLPASSVVATRAAGDRCRSCGHSRLRHSGTRNGGCVGIVWTLVGDRTDTAPTIARICACAAFADQEVLPHVGL